MSQPPSALEISLADPREPEAAALIGAMTAEVTAIYDHKIDGAGNFKAGGRARSGQRIPRGARREPGGGVRRIPPAGAGSGRDQADVRRARSIGDGATRRRCSRRSSAWQGRADTRPCGSRRAPKQAAAIALYEGLGYVRIPNYGMYEGREDCLCYEKPLSAVESRAANLDRGIKSGRSGVHWTGLWHTSIHRCT